MTSKSVAPLNGRCFTVTSLFTGCGGLDLGFAGGFVYRRARYSRNPFTIVSAYDNDPSCAKTYSLNFSNGIDIVDLSKAPPESLLPADVLIGGFPCQDFSACGNRLGLASERGRLYKVMIRYLRHHQPLAMVAENVPHLEYIDSGRALRKIIRDIEAAGYFCTKWHLDAADYGVPQRRRRLVLMCTRKDLGRMPSVPPKRHGTARTIEWAIADLRKPASLVPNQEQYFKAAKAKNGNGQGDETSIRGRPGYTVRANSRSRVQFHYSLARRLTVRECARLQTFPDDFVFPHSATRNTKQIGNAVPPVLAHQIAACLARFLGDIAHTRGVLAPNTKVSV
jgi:DNA (cytosine-5)-methyltransferase 1